MNNTDKVKPHGDKLTALMENPKLPISDRPRVKAQIELYNDWISKMGELKSKGEQLVIDLVELLNVYKKSVEFDLIFCSEEDFLYRQKGQLKLDNTILEEFLPWLFNSNIIPALKNYSGLKCGPQKSFAGLSFGSPQLELSKGGASVKAKDQDFSITRKHMLGLTNPESKKPSFSKAIYVSYFASELKTNLDKTMFQEGSATASELKRVSTGSRYLLICEWLDMKPIDSKLTAMDEVIILRKAKRLGSQVRSTFSKSAGRKKQKDFFENFLNEHPISLDGIKRIVWHMEQCFPERHNIDEKQVLSKGYF